MTIDISHLDRTATFESPAEAHGVAPSAVATAVASGAAATPSPSAVAAAVQQVQSAIDTGPNPSFKLDYLSGLSVVTVRSALTGEVVFQLPDRRALELAQLLKDGASLGSLGLLNTKA